MIYYDDHYFYETCFNKKCVHLKFNLTLERPKKKTRKNSPVFSLPYLFKLNALRGNKRSSYISILVRFVFISNFIQN